MLSLGCLGLEPIIDALSGPTANAAMTCSGGAMAASSSVDSQGMGVVAAPGQSSAGSRYDCGCQSCTAAAVAVPGAQTVRIDPVHARSAVVVQLVGIATRPLLPPPQRTL